MKLNLQEKRALITGSNVGIGQAIAKTLAEEGVAVVIHGLKEDKVTHVTEKIRQNGGKAFGIKSDRLDFNLMAHYGHNNDNLQQ
ncbi:SDR family NAD(P)-dependent oxidoreductase [Pleurocapsa sp. PCC 7319]|uniref:SDR family NAD(P)-dependent oxidoreductase n=1 Tax=Pleurocapsa sp. PCC 7319 TaxID=118161 RepID=UPI000344B3E8|nr:SDR family NAD(P)-dependent oxidoreductase [Pleurocapsa sp. PCC 7319]